MKSGNDEGYLNTFGIAFVRAVHSHACPHPPTAIVTLTRTFSFEGTTQGNENHPQTAKAVVCF